MSFQGRDDLCALASELWTKAQKNRKAKWWNHAGPPYLHEIVAWLLRQYRDLERRRGKSQKNRKAKIRALKDAGIG